MRILTPKSRSNIEKSLAELFEILTTHKDVELCLKCVNAIATIGVEIGLKAEDVIKEGEQ